MQGSEVQLNYYLSLNIHNICRVCLEKGNSPARLTPIFDPIKPPHFPNLIMACASVNIVQNDGFPSLICSKCIAKLHVAYQFKQTCETSDAKLRQYFNSIQQMPQPPDLANFTIEIKKDDLTFEAEPQPQSLSDNLGTDIEISNLQPMGNHQLDSQQLNNTDLCDLSNQNSHNNDIIKQEDLFKPPTIVEGSENKMKETTSKKKCMQHQCDTCGKTFKARPSLIHHIRIHTGERPYVCHLCNKRFINGGHLHTHMRTHTGEKNHACSACNKAFATAQQLTKHTIAIHTSERPYACSYCMKRFASSSNLNTHIKIHTGEKNYHCERCGKAFSTKGQLYQHMLVHTKEKAFLCEFCNKRFSQKAHLVRHLKMHKRIIE